MENSWAALPYPTQQGQVGGHEGVGTIVKMGPATGHTAVKVGDRVGIKWVADIWSFGRPGTFQQYVLSQADYVSPIPEKLTSEEAALASRGMAMRVIGIDAGSKEQLVRDCGAEHFIDVTKHDDRSISEEVVKTTDGLGASAMHRKQSGVRPIDRRLPGKPEPIGNAFPAKMIFKGITIASTAVGNRKDAIEVLDFAARGEFEIEPALCQQP
ncbi:MAG: hypothetical protein Q9176_004599 [Flavoplaca citrina]